MNICLLLIIKKQGKEKGRTVLEKEWRQKTEEEYYLDEEGKKDQSW